MQPTIKSYFIDNKEKLSNFIPDIPWEKIMFYLSSHINKNEILLKCSKLSIFDSFRKAVSMNLKLDPSYGEVSFVPYWNNLKKIYEAELIPGYKAYIRIAHEIYDAKVFSGTFTYDDIKDGYFKGYNSIEKIIEIDSCKFLSTKIKSKDNISHVWVSIQTDIKRIDHLYSKEEIEERARYKDKIRTKSPWSSSIRKTDYEEMLKKTAIKHALKLMPWPEILKISDVDNKTEEKTIPKLDMKKYFPEIADVV